MCSIEQQTGAQLAVTQIGWRNVRGAYQGRCLGASSPGNAWRVVGDIWGECARTSRGNVRSSCMITSLCVQQLWFVTPWLTQAHTHTHRPRWPQTWKIWSTQGFLRTWKTWGILGNSVQPYGKFLTDKIVSVWSTICITHKSRASNEQSLMNFGDGHSALVTCYIARVDAEWPSTYEGHYYIYFLLQ